MTLFAASLYGDMIFFLFCMACMGAWAAVEAAERRKAAREAAEAALSAPVLTYDVVYPNGLRKTVEARTAEEAATIVAGDANLKHDVALYLNGKLAGTVRPQPDGSNRPDWF